VPPMERTMHAEIREEIFLAQRSEAPGSGQRNHPRVRHERIIGHSIGVIKEPPVQLKLYSRRFMDKAKIPTQLQQQPKLRVTNLGGRIVAPIAGLHEHRARLWQCLKRNQKINVLSTAQAESAERQHGKRRPFDEQCWYIGFIEQALQP